MSDEFINILMKILAIAIYISLGVVASWIYYSIKKKDLFGGFTGGMVVGVIGALIGGFILDRLLLDIVIKILEFLVYETGVNIIAGFIGAYIAVFIMNKLGHDKDRKRY